MKRIFVWLVRIALGIVDNANLQELWNWQQRPHKLRILRGRVSFLLNRRLCYEKLKSFLQDGVVFGVAASAGNGNATITAQQLPVATLNFSRDASALTNGDMAICNRTKFHLFLKGIASREAVLYYAPYKPLDSRTLLGYRVLYKPV